MPSLLLRGNHGRCLLPLLEVSRVTKNIQRYNLAFPDPTKIRITKDIPMLLIAEANLSRSFSMRRNAASVLSPMASAVKMSGDSTRALFERFLHNAAGAASSSFLSSLFWFFEFSLLVPTPLTLVAESLNRTENLEDYVSLFGNLCVEHDLNIIMLRCVTSVSILTPPSPSLTSNPTAFNQLLLSFAQLLNLMSDFYLFKKPLLDSPVFSAAWKLAGDLHISADLLNQSLLRIANYLADIELCLATTATFPGVQFGLAVNTKRQFLLPVFDSDGGLAPLRHRLVIERMAAMATAGTGLYWWREPNGVLGELPNDHQRMLFGCALGCSSRFLTSSLTSYHHIFFRFPQIPPL